MKLEAFLDLLISPSDQQPLEIVDRSSLAERSSSSQEFVSVKRIGGDAKPMGATDRLLLVKDGSSAFPIIDGIPVLLTPERLVPSDQRDTQPTIDLQDPKFAEAYQEMEFYNQMRDSQMGGQQGDQINQILGALADYEDISSIKDSFPDPENVWVDARHDSVSQLEAYRYLAPVTDKIFLQMGGSGSHAVKMLLAGARMACLLTPMIGEAQFALQLAENYGVADRLACVLAVGEELPFADGSIDLVYSGGCFHHMRLDHVGAELSRVLKSGGKFSGVDPWKTPLHTIGTKVLGKREPSVFCRPITDERLSRIKRYFPDLHTSRNGPYLALLFPGSRESRIATVFASNDAHHPL